MKRLPQRNPPRPSALVALACLLALAFAVYGRALGHGFLLDDETQIVGNPAIHSLANLPSLFLSSTNHQTGSDRLQGIYYKPIMTTAFALLWSIDGANGGVFHGAQLILVALNAWMVFWLLRRSFQPALALGAAALFLIHPANCEVAVYAADLQDALYFAFGLGALLAASREGPWRAGRTAGVAALLLLSLLSKESGILFAFAVAAWVAIRRRDALGKGAIACGAAGLAYAGLRFGLAGMTSVVGESWAQMGHSTLLERASTMPQILLHYAKLIVWPSRLVVAQDWIVRESSLAETWLPLGAVAGIASTLAVAGRRAARAGWIRPGWAPFWMALMVAGLALHLQIVPLDGTVADRWVYVPFLALLAWLCPFAEHILSSKTPQIRRGFLVAYATVFCALGATTHERVGDWKSGRALYESDVQKDPENGLLQNNLGVELFRAGSKLEALGRFERATRLSPHWTIPWNNLGAAYESFSRWDEAEVAYRTSVERGVYHLAFENYPMLLFRKGKRAEALKFIEDTGLRALPSNPTLLALRAELRGSAH